MTTAAPSVADDIVWSPNSRRQERFLASTARELIYAGQSGGGKTSCMLAAPLRWMSLPGYSAVILRRTWTDLKRSILGQAFDLYPRCGGQHHEGGRRWTWPGGGEILFTSMERAEDRFNFKGGEHCFIGFEELDTFEEVQYTYLLSRQRTSRKMPNGEFYPLRMRANANPGGPGTDWIVRRWGPWIYHPPQPKLDVHGRPLIGRDGQPVMVQHPDTPSDFVGPFVKEGTKLHALTDPKTGARLYVPKGTRGEEGDAAISTVFIKSVRTDNIALDQDAYLTSLSGLDPLTREQLAKGNWFARPTAGMFFSRSWDLDLFQDAPPPRAVMRVRVWDRAATVASAENTDPDWTAGVLMSVDGEGLIWIEDVDRFRAAPGDVQKRIAATAELDRQRIGTATDVCLLHDPGQAGKFEMESYVRHPVLGRSRVIPLQVHHDKVTMGKPFSGAASNKRVRIVRAPWNVELLSELERFPEGAHDDQWDCVANGYRVLHGMHGGQSSSSGGGEQKARAGTPSMHRNPGGF